jgi:hypothetical protein
MGNYFCCSSVEVKDPPEDEGNPVVKLPTLAPMLGRTFSERTLTPTD